MVLIFNYFKCVEQQFLICVNLSGLQGHVTFKTLKFTFGTCYATVVFLTRNNFWYLATRVVVYGGLDTKVFRVLVWPLRVLSANGVSAHLECAGRLYVFGFSIRFC